MLIVGVVEASGLFVFGDQVAVPVVDAAVGDHGHAVLGIAHADGGAVHIGAPDLHGDGAVFRRRHF